MATRKSAGKGGTKSATRSASATTRPGAAPPYGQAIRDAIARGDAAEMRRVAAGARKHVSDIQSALDRLDKALRK